MSEVSLTIDGTEHRGWKSVSITRSLDQLAAGFTLGLTDRWQESAARRPVSEHTAVTVAVDGVTVISGRIDQVSPGYDEESHSISVSGRSVTGQLADCSAEVETGELRGLSLAAAAQRLCAPLNVAVVDLADQRQAFDRIEIEPGESVAEVLGRLAQQRGVFLTDDVNGRLVIRRRSEAVQAYLQTGDYKSCEATFDGTKQFSEIQVKGQRTGSDVWTPAAASAPAGIARDASVPLHRPLVILPETQGDPAALRDRAIFEVALRRGRARVWNYDVTGWYRPDGALWRDGEEIGIEDAFMGLDDNLLVVGVTFTLDEKGERTTLRLGQPEGYDLRAIPAVKRESTGWP